MTDVGKGRAGYPPEQGVCDECAIAQDRVHHAYMSSCKGCTARALARSPEFLREGYLDTLPPEEREPMLEAARAEWKREKGLRA